MAKTAHDSGSVAASSRRFQIVELTVEQGSVSINSLAGRFGVSIATINTDLLQLTKLIPLLERGRGNINFKYLEGAFGTYFGNNLKDTELFEQKSEIAQYVVTEILNTRDLVILGPGSTTCHVCKQMAATGSNYVVCTNNLALPEIAGNLSLFCLGGEFTRDIWANTGRMTEDDFDDFMKEHEKVNKAVLGTSGITESGAVFVHNASETGILKKFIDNSPVVVFATSGAKLGKADTSYLTRLSEMVWDPLFHIGLKHQASFDNGKVPDDLRGKSENSASGSKLPLSQNITVEVKEKGSNWLITDEDSEERYFVRKDEDKLGVYAETGKQVWIVTSCVKEDPKKEEEESKELDRLKELKSKFEGISKNVHVEIVPRRK